MGAPVTAADGLTVYRPGSAEYARATAPHNPSGTQRPAAVVVPQRAAQVAAAVTLAADQGWALAPQATGHGAAGDIGPDTLLLDTSALDEIAIDPAAGLARTGAGATWSRVNAAAEPHGLLGRAGTSPSVGVAGYTFGGGIGWLVRPHGLAAAHLETVDFVDAGGRQRRASADAADPIDRDAWWAFRGGYGAGVATSLEFGLVPVSDLWAGYLLWPASALDAVTAAWAGSLPAAGPALVTCISLLRAAPGPPFPPELQGTAVVHLSLASAAGEPDAAALLRALRAAPAPVVNTWGPASAQRLGGIHLDPPSGIPALGGGRWLAAGTPDVTADLLRLGLRGGSPLMMIEVRHVAGPGPADDLAGDGAMTRPPGPFLVHAVGAAGTPEHRAELDGALQSVWDAAAPVDTGRPAPPFAEGQRAAGTALTAADEKRLTATRAALDPGSLIRYARVLP
ncbi:MAG TPA: FAD-binding protein [Streptosporangiaceae bacterium]|jgi:hypothetical protein